ncbi:MAG: cell division protein FtsK, partial [Alphaproteobacteria bacterium]|nr:cell division protein FtsK [Alphaproteobacteria bacterium]
DMLYMAGGGRIQRVHGPFVKDEEVERIVNFLKTQGEPSYVESVTQDDEEDAAVESGSGGDDDKDQLYQQAVELILREGKASTSFVQRHLQIGYNRAARLIDLMEKDGVISPANHAGKREILGRNYA